MLQALGR